MSSNKTIVLPAIAWEVVRILLQQPGWANTPRDIFVAGSLDDKLNLPKKPAAEPKTGRPDPAKDEAWSKKPISFQLMAKEFDCIAKCVRSNIEKTNVGAGKTAKALVEAFLPEEC